MKIKQLREAITNKIKEMLPDLRCVTTHPGRFNLNELKRIATQLPAVRVAILGVPTVDVLETGENVAHLKIAAFVIAGDRRRLSKDEAALAIVESLLVLIPCQRFGVKGAMDAKRVRADNLFSGQIERQGVAMWAITWEQSVRIGVDIWGGGTLPSSVYVSDDSKDFSDKDKYSKAL